MIWTLIILFGLAVGLLIVSSVKSKQSSTVLERQIDQTSFTIMNEVHQLQKQIREMELDAEISAQEAGILSLASEQRILLREMLDLQRRGYSLNSIAEKKELPLHKVEELLAPYTPSKGERSDIA